MKIIKGKRGDLDKKLISIIEKSFKEILMEKGEMIFGIPGGRSVKGIFKKLRRADIDWHRVHIFWIDERFVSFKNKESNFKLANDLFISDLVKKGKLPLKNVHAFNYRENVKDYERDFRRFGGNFDFVLTGIGDDCHIASLFPGKKLNSKEDFFIIYNSPKFPKERMSVSGKILARSKIGVILVYGKEKKEAYEKFKKIGQITNCPARIMKKIKKLYVISSF